MRKVDRMRTLSENDAVSMEIAAESLVLLKNHQALPLAPNSRIALFGHAQTADHKGGWGSGNVTVAHVVTILEAMQEAEKEGAFTLAPCLVNAYQTYFDPSRRKWDNVVKSKSLNLEFPEMELSAELVAQARTEADVAIVTLTRITTECFDYRLLPGDWLLSDSEKRMFSLIAQENFAKVIVLLNVPGPIDCSWMKEYRIDAMLTMHLPGSVGAYAAVDALCGKINPSGKLPDTWAERYEDYPAGGYFDEASIQEYSEDIYLGYRYFETFDMARDKVIFPFGLGLSYTVFESKCDKVVACHKSLRFTIEVRNSGDRAGKEVVQLYVGAPQGGLGRPARELVAFAKTPLLSPGKSCTLELDVPYAIFSAFDENGRSGHLKCRVLEAGTYHFYLGGDVRTAQEIDTITLPETLVIEETLVDIAPAVSFQKMRFDGSFEAVTTASATSEKRPSFREYVSEKISFADVISYPELIPEFVACFSEEELLECVGGKPAKIANVGTIGDIPSYHLRAYEMFDGPAGVRAEFTATAFPCASAQAATWNVELIALGTACLAREARSHSLDIWLGPGMNLHHDMRCGRNFEYYSEDPVLSGKIAAAAVRGCQGEGVAAVVKHFAANHKEEERRMVDARISARALRDIYLRNFEIVIKDAAPMFVMTSYNLVNGIHASEHRNLIEGVLRMEWHFVGGVTSDWENAADVVLEQIAGNDLHMPSGKPDELRQALREGRLEISTLRRNVEHLIEALTRLERSRANETFYC